MRSGSKRIRKSQNNVIFGSSGIGVEAQLPLFPMLLEKNRLSEYLDLAMEFSDPSNTA